jgi:hypothetical protein
MKKTVAIIIFLVALIIVGIAVKKYKKGELVLPLGTSSVATSLSLELQNSGFPLPEPAKIVDGDTIEASISGIRVLFPYKTDQNSHLLALQIIYKEITMEKGKPKEIDLRFQKPIIRY